MPPPGRLTCQQKTEIDAGAGYREIRGLASWSVGKQAGQLAGSYQISAADKDSAAVSKVKINAGYGTAPADLIPLLQDATVETISSEWRDGVYLTSVFGLDGADRIIQLAPQKTLIFLAREYVDKYAQGYEWRVNPDSQIIEGYYWYQGHRYFWPLRIFEVPSDPGKAGTFETIIVQNSRNEVLGWLAAALEITIHNGCPETPFRGALVLQDTQTHFNAVRELVSLWNPLMTMVREGNAWVLYILDVEDGQTMPGGFSIRQDLLTVLGISEERQAIVNRLTVTGAEKESPPGARGLFAPPKNRQPIEFSVDYEVERLIETDPTTGKALPSCDTYADHARTRVKKGYAYDPADIYNRLLVSEEIAVFGAFESGDNLVSKKTTTYRYLDYTAAIGQDVEEWHRVRLPGTSIAILEKIKTRKTIYGDYVDEAGEIERVEVEEGLVIYDHQTVSGQSKRINPQEVHVANENQTIDIRVSSTQSYLWATIRRRQTRYEVEDSQRVRRDTVIFHCLTGTVETETEYIPISYKYERGGKDRRRQARWEFEDAASIAAHGYRPRVEISLEELKEGIDDALAEEIWSRVKRKSGASVITARVGLPAWVPALVGEKLTVQPITIKEWASAGGFASRVIPGGDYYVTGVEHGFQGGKGEASLTTSLTLRSAFQRNS